MVAAVGNDGCIIAGGAGDSSDGCAVSWRGSCAVMVANASNTWLQKPQLYGFHWFHGGGFYDGFPSWHMAVFAALIAALWRFYPRCRSICLFFLLALASALIVTNYHFLGDVLAGAYLGVLVEEVSYRLLLRQHGFPGS